MSCTQLQQIQHRPIYMFYFYSNSQNCRILIAQNPEVIKKKQNSLKIYFGKKNVLISVCRLQHQKFHVIQKAFITLFCKLDPSPLHPQPSPTPNHHCIVFSVLTLLSIICKVSCSLFPGFWQIWNFFFNTSKYMIVYICAYLIHNIMISNKQYKTIKIF